MAQGTAASATAALIDDLEYDFVEEPPDDFNCIVCLDVLSEPHLTLCCGKHYCKKCIQRVLSDGKPCPHCKEDEFSAVKDKNTERRVLDQKVRCTFKELGCPWVGEMRYLAKHTDMDKGACEYRRVKCANNCGEVVSLKSMERHLEELCPGRKIICEYCNANTTHGELNDHYKICNNFPVVCPNKCGPSTIQQGSLEQHLAHCPFQVMDCEFRGMGCIAKIRRMDMPRHLETSTQEHLTKMSRLCVDLVRVVQEKNKELEELVQRMEEKDRQMDDLRISVEARNDAVTKELEDRDREIAQLHGALRALEVDSETKIQAQQDLFRTNLQRQDTRLQSLELQHRTRDNQPHNLFEISQRVQTLETLVNVPPFYFTMTNFSLHKRGGTQWMCPPFYNELGGYKLALEVSAYGEGAGKGTHLSVYIRILRGEYDGQLTWPLRASIMIQLISQLNNAHYEMMTPVYHWTRVNEGVVGVGWGWDKFIAHTDLEFNAQRRTEYLRNDRLNFRVICVDKEQ